MADISDAAKVRLLGGGPGDKPPASLSSLSQASAPTEAVAKPAATTVPAPAPAGQAIFLSDSDEGADALGIAELIQPLAQLCAAAQTQTPFLAAILGPSGAGKSFAIGRLQRAIEALRGGRGSLGRVVVARLDAADGVEAPIALASAAYAALDREPGGADYSALLDESAHAGGDPLRAAQAASDRHEEIVRKLEAERAQLDEAEARGARLADALLFETPGSRVDVFARSRRGAIDARLRRFDLAGPDAAASYREFVRDMAGMGAAGRVGLALRAIWGFPGQRRLIFWAIFAALAGVGVGMLPQESILSAIPLQAQTVSDWIRDHAAWFATGSKILYVLAVLALVLNLWRAIGVSSLLFRGARLLNQDLRDRRRDLDARLARLNQRVAALTADAEAAARQAEAALKRAGGKAHTRAPGPEFIKAGHGPASAARAFLAALGEKVGRGPAAPDRIVFLIDNLDALPPGAAIGWIGAAHGAIGPGAVAVLALDSGRLVEPLGGPREARRRLDKWLQAVVNLPPRAGMEGERLVARLLSTDGKPSLLSIDAKAVTALNEPLTAAESSLLTALAPLFAHSPRHAKKFLNAYRLARSSGVPGPVLALMQAVAFADDAVRAAMAEELASAAGVLGDVQAPETLQRAIRSARAANSGEILVADARAADAVARRYALSV